MSNSKYEEIDLFEIFEAIWKSRFTVIGITLFFALLSVAIALSLPNKFRSEATVMPTKQNEQGGLSSLAGQLGGMAGLAGLSLNTNVIEPSQVALEVLSSRRFTQSFIERHEILPELIAVTEWNKTNNTLSYDSEVYNRESQQWNIDDDSGESLKPTNQTAFEAMQASLEFEVTQNGFIKIRFEHISPSFAEFVVENIVSDLNTEMKQRDIKESERAIDYLKIQLQETNLTDIRTVLYRLIEEHTKTLMFASARDEYAFTTIDPAVVPEKPSSPNRAMICLIITLVGLVIGMVIAISRASIAKRRARIAA